MIRWIWLGFVVGGFVLLGSGCQSNNGGGVTEAFVEEGVLAEHQPGRNPNPTNPGTSRTDNAVCTNYPDQADSPYSLPYAVGDSYEVWQGNCGSLSHGPASPFTFAYDFDMVIGTEILASRPGTVVAIEESHENGTVRSGDENYVIISHGDGTFGRYIHLTTNGALVEVDDEVAQGDVVGLSGNSGLSMIPHLHFDVTEGCATPDCPTLPVVFNNTASHPNGLVEDVYYEAE